MTKEAAKKKRLQEAMASGELVLFTHRFEGQSLRGYVQAAGPEFFLLLTTSDRIWFDGFECFRYLDVSSVHPDPTTAFIERALELRKAKRPEEPLIDLADSRRLLESAGRAAALVTICTEEIDPEVCYIGRVVEVNDEYVTLQEINPGADWETETTRYALADITRVAFGQDYEEALHLVGGEPPAL